MCQLPGDQTPHDGPLDNEDAGQDEQEQQHRMENTQEALLAEEGR